MMVEIGLDAGFGDVKVVASIAEPEEPKDDNISTERIKYIKFKYPTAIAYAKQGIIGELADEREYEFQGRRYVVGSAALQCRDVFSTRDIEFLMRYSPLLTYAAIERIGRESGISMSALLAAERRLCLGIPLAYYSRRDELYRALSDFTVSENSVSFDSIDVRAQGQGILFDYVLDNTGRPRNDRAGHNVLVLDIGFHTVDILGVIDGSPNREWSGMLESGGVCRVCEELKAYLQRKLNFTLAEQVVKDVLQKGSIALYGAERDLTTAIRTAKEAYSDWLSSEVNAGWNDFLKRADRLIVAGGGAYYIDGLRARYPQEFVHVAEQPEYANARGFLKFMMQAGKHCQDEE